MKHLAELHIGDGLEQYADEIHMRALMMQSNLDNTAIAISHIKNIAQARFTPDNEETKEDQETSEFFRKTDALVMQIRSAKVVAGKATGQLDELKKSSLTLDPSTKPVVEQVQDSTSALAASTLTTCSPVFKLLQGEDQDTPLTYQEFSRTIFSSATQPLSALSSPVHSVTTQLHAFYNLTNSLTQTVEFPCPPPPPPWQLLAQNMRTASATSATHEVEVGRLRDEMAEKETALALQEKEAEEMSVKVEVLAKRVGESGGRREKIRELEAAVETRRVKEQDLLSHLAHLQRNLRELETEREAWKKSPQHQPLPVDPLSNNANNSPSSLHQIQVLKSEIVALQSSIGYLRTASHNYNLSSSLSFLSAPLVPPPPAPRTTLRSEAADVLREMLHLTTRPENQIVQLKPMQPKDRLKWRPLRETSGWTLSRQMEEWQTWKEWKNSVTEKAIDEGIAKAQQSPAKEKGVATDLGGGEAIVIAQATTRVKAGAGGQVRVVSPGDWDDVGRLLGIDRLGFEGLVSTSES